MKKLGKLKLNQISKADMEKREMNLLRGGDRCCICGCRGSSSNSENSGANIRGGAGGYVPGDGGGGGGYGSFGA